MFYFCGSPLKSEVTGVPPSTLMESQVGKPIACTEIVHGSYRHCNLCKIVDIYIYIHTYIYIYKCVCACMHIGVNLQMYFNTNIDVYI